jgi:rhamnose utilization protein RhaD (predicted bifunctional aldolase and dehydrogenase)
MPNANLQDLVDHSFRIGANLDFVQLSGGNTSKKQNGVLIIKASGKRLRDAKDLEIFCSVPFDSLTLDQIVNSTDFATLQSSHLKPSIETNFHLLIPSKFVTHLHSLGSIAFGLLMPGLTISTDFLNEADVIEIEYARPGVNLVQKIMEAQYPSQGTFLLRNHGVIYHSDELYLLDRKIQSTEALFFNAIESLPAVPGYPDWIDILTQGVLTPDEAVFLGRRPFTKSENEIGDSIAINSNGQLLFPKGITSEKRSMAEFYVRVAKSLDKKTTVIYLPDSEVEALLEWDKEKIRIAMSK